MGPVVPVPIVMGTYSTNSRGRAGYCAFGLPAQALTRVPHSQVGRVPARSCELYWSFKTSIVSFYLNDKRANERFVPQID